MTVEAAIAQALPELRREAEARMVDTCRITRPGDGDPVFNNDTGQYDQPAPVPVYEGKCRIPSGGGTLGRNGAAAEQSFAVGEYPLDLPALTEGIAAGQTVTYLTSPDNPTLAGMVFGITEPLLASQSTKQRWKIKAAVAQ